MSLSGSSVQGGVGRVESGVSLTVNDPGHDVSVSGDQAGHGKSPNGREQLNLLVSYVP